MFLSRGGHCAEYWGFPHSCKGLSHIFPSGNNSARKIHFIPWFIQALSIECLLCTIVQTLSLFQLETQKETLRSCGLTNATHKVVSPNWKKEWKKEEWNKGREEKERKKGNVFSPDPTSSRNRCSYFPAHFHSNLSRKTKRWLHLPNTSSSPSHSSTHSSLLFMLTVPLRQL